MNRWSLPGASAKSGRPTRACSCRGPAGIVLQTGVVGATLGAGRLRAPGPAGLRQGGGASQLTPKSVGPTGPERPFLAVLCPRSGRRYSSCMAQPLTVPPPGFDDLPVEEQIDYVQALWDRIAATPDRVPVPDWHKAILDERLADLEANPDDSVPWEQVRDELRAKLRRVR